jgi:hypothetical protein
LEKLAIDKQPSLFGRCISDEEKSFVTLTPAYLAVASVTNNNVF